jgi:C4-dicarboxylate transporter DctM subunit
MALWIFIVFMVALVFAVPIAISMVLGALTPIFLGGPGSSIQQLIANSFSGSDSTPILAVPLFILAGVLMAEGGISRRLFNFFAYFIGNLTGGLPCAVINNMFVLWSNFRLRTCDNGSGWLHDHTIFG